MAFFQKHDPSESGGNLAPVCSVCVVTSAKGGVGKSTVCANLGAALAMRGLSVLMLDCDMPNRCLDLLFGLSEDVTCGLTDVLSGTVSPDDAILSCSDRFVLDLLPGFSSSGDETASCYEKVYDLLLSLRQKYYDVLLVDMPGGSVDLLAKVAKGADRALIVSTEQSTAIRSAASTARLLSDAGLTDQQLIINQFVGGKNRRERENQIRMKSFAFRSFSKVSPRSIKGSPPRTLRTTRAQWTIAVRWSCSRRPCRPRSKAKSVMT